MLLLRGNDQNSKILLFEFDTERRIFYADEIPSDSKEARMRSIQPIGDEGRIVIEEYLGNNLPRYLRLTSIKRWI